MHEGADLVDRALEIGTDQGAGGANPGFVTAGKFLQDIVNEGFFNKGFNGAKDDEARRLFFNGKAGMMLMGTWILAKAKSEAPEFLTRMGCFSCSRPGAER